MVRKPVYRAAFAALAGAAGVCFLHTGGHLIRLDWLTPLLWLIPSFLFYILFRPSELRRKKAIGSEAPVFVLIFFAVLYLFSSGVNHGWTYFLEWTPRHAGDMRSGAVRLILISALLWPLIVRGWIKPVYALLAILLLSQAASIHLLLTETGGDALYRDDHPSFMYRLYTFAKTYPRLINYDPCWNAGFAGYAETTSGTTGLGILFWPIWGLAPVHEVYTYVLGFLFIVLVPLITAFSLALMGAGWGAGLAAAILALGVSQHFFLWLLNYGTVGSCTAIFFIIPAYALAFRAVWLGRTGFWTGFALVFSVFMLMQWPPGAIMAAPLVLSLLFSSNKWSRRKFVFLAVCVLAVLALYWRTVWLFMSTATSHMDYVLTASQGGKSGALVLPELTRLAAGWEHLLAHLREGHPFPVFLGIIGVFFLPLKGLRRWFGPAIVALALITGWGRDLFPKLQISRMAIPLMFLGVIPAGIACSKALKRRNPAVAPLQAAVLAVLLLGGWNVARIWGNQNLKTHYVTMTERMREIVKWLNENAEDDGRLMFAGATVHAYGGGHVAYLPVLTGREMISCDHYAFPADSHEYRMPPRSYQATPDEVWQYIDLHDVTWIITYHHGWKEDFSAEPERYREEAVFRDMSIFRVLREPSRFHKGSGGVVADFNKLKVTLDSGSEEAVIRYAWSDELRVKPPAEIFPVSFGDGVDLIGIRPNGSRQCTITYRKRF